MGLKRFQIWQITNRLKKWANIQSISKNKKRHRRQQQQDFLVDVLLDPDSLILTSLNE